MLISPWAILLKNILETDRVKSPVIKLQSCEKKLRKCSKTKVLGQKQNRAFFMDHPVNQWHVEKSCLFYEKGYSSVA